MIFPHWYDWLIVFAPYFVVATIGYHLTRRWYMRQPYTRVLHFGPLPSWGLGWWRWITARYWLTSEWMWQAGKHWNLLSAKVVALDELRELGEQQSEIIRDLLRQRADLNIEIDKQQRQRLAAETKVDELTAQHRGDVEVIGITSRQMMELLPVWWAAYMLVQAWSESSSIPYVPVSEAEYRLLSAVARYGTPTGQNPYLADTEDERFPR